MVENAEEYLENQVRRLSDKAQEWSKFLVFVFPEISYHRFERKELAFWDGFWKGPWQRHTEDVARLYRKTQTQDCPRNPGAFWTLVAKRGAWQSWLSRKGSLCAAQFTKIENLFKQEDEEPTEEGYEDKNQGQTEEAEEEPEEEQEQDGDNPNKGKKRKSKQSTLLEIWKKQKTTAPKQSSENANFRSLTSTSLSSSSATCSATSTSTLTSTSLRFSEEKLWDGSKAVSSPEAASPRFETLLPSHINPSCTEIELLWEVPPVMKLQEDALQTFTPFPYSQAAAILKQLRSDVKRQKPNASRVEISKEQSMYSDIWHAKIFERDTSAPPITITVNIFSTALTAVLLQQTLAQNHKEIISRLDRIEAKQSQVSQGVVETQWNEDAEAEAETETETTIGCTSPYEYHGEGKPPPRFKSWVKRIREAEDVSFVKRVCANGELWQLRWKEHGKHGIKTISYDLTKYPAAEAQTQCWYDILKFKRDFK